MSALFLGIISFLYLGAGLEFAIERNWPWLMICVCYAIANICVIWVSRN